MYVIEIVYLHLATFLYRHMVSRTTSVLELYCSEVHTHVGIYMDQCMLQQYIMLQHCVLYMLIMEVHACVCTNVHTCTVECITTQVDIL